MTVPRRVSFELQVEVTVLLTHGVNLRLVSLALHVKYTL